MQEQDALTQAIIGAAIEVHRILGPGLLENIYELALAYELTQRSLNFVQQKQIPITYKGIALGHGKRLDLVVEDKVIVEIKSVERFTSVHTAQLLSYMRLDNKQVGLLVNFNVRILTKGGIKRFVL